MKTIAAQNKSDKLDAELSEILYDCVIGGWATIESDGFTNVNDGVVVETIKKIHSLYKKRKK